MTAENEYKFFMYDPNDRRMLRIKATDTFCVRISVPFVWVEKEDGTGCKEAKELNDLKTGSRIWLPSPTSGMIAFVVNQRDSGELYGDRGECEATLEFDDGWRGKSIVMKITGE